MKTSNVKSRFVSRREDLLVGDGPLDLETKKSTLELGRFLRAEVYKEEEKTLYVSRRLKNANAFVAWAKSQGFGAVVVPDDIHVTLAFSRKPIKWDTIGRAQSKIIIPAGRGVRTVATLGDKGAVVLKFEEPKFNKRWEDLKSKGASWDWDSFFPHLTITYDGSDVDLEKIVPYNGRLVFGPERFEEVEEDWSDKVKEQSDVGQSRRALRLGRLLGTRSYYSPDQDRDEEGKFAPEGGSGGGESEGPSGRERGSESSSLNQDKGSNEIKDYLGIVSKAEGLGTGRSPAEFVLSSGKSYKFDESSFKGPRGKVHQCFCNAGRLALDDPDLTYVEGYVNVGGIPLEHAWTVDKVGHVIDPTITSSHLIRGYFGVPFKKEYLRKAILLNKVWGLLGHKSKKTLPALLEGRRPEALFVSVYYSPDQAREPAGSEGGGRFAPREGGSGKSESGTDSGSSSLSAESASDLFRQTADPNVTPNQVLSKFSSKDRQLIEDARSRVAKSTPTDALESQGGFKRADGTYTAERQKLHEDIIQKILTSKQVASATPAPGVRPTFTIIGGRAGSGKSFFTSRDGPVDANKALVLNNDEIKAMIPEYRGWNAALVHEESSQIFQQVDSMARSLGLNVVHDSTIRTGSSAKGWVNKYKKAGYDVVGYYMFAPPAIAAERATARFISGSKRVGAGNKTGRFVPIEYILSSTTNEQSFDELRSEFKSWTVYSSLGKSPKLVAKGGR